MAATDTGENATIRTLRTWIGAKNEPRGSQGNQNVGDVNAWHRPCRRGTAGRRVDRRSWRGAGSAVMGVSLLYRGMSGYCALFGAMGIDSTRAGSSTNAIGRRKVHTSQATKIRRTIEINRPPAELYRYWRTLENLPRVMSRLESVQVINDRLSHWVVKTLPGAPSVEWDAEIINDIEHERIGWRSLTGADVDNTGSVEFEPAGDGQRTRLTVTLQYAPPAGASAPPLRSCWVKIRNTRSPGTWNVSRTRWNRAPNREPGADNRRAEERRTTLAGGVQTHLLSCLSGHAGHRAHIRTWYMGKSKAADRRILTVQPDDHVTAAPKAAMTMVAYCDFECPYCGRAYHVVTRLMGRFGDRLQFVFRHFPLREKHPFAGGGRGVFGSGGGTGPVLAHA